MYVGSWTWVVLYLTILQEIHEYFAIASVTDADFYNFCSLIAYESMLSVEIQQTIHIQPSFTSKMRKGVRKRAEIFAILKRSY